MLTLPLRSQSGLPFALTLDRDRMRRYSQLEPKLVSVVSHDGPERQRVEHFIKHVYASSYQATIQVRYPLLMSVQDGAGNILAAVGFRPAALHALFLEQYLLAPVELLLTTPERATGRSGIVEVGNLASQGKGASLYLFTALAAYLRQNGYQWVVVTATRSLHQHFRRLGLQPQILGKATREKLAMHGEHWGSYYETDPVILAGTLDAACEHLTQVFQMEYKQMPKDWQAYLHSIKAGWEHDWSV